MFHFVLSRLTQRELRWVKQVFGQLFFFVNVDVDLPWSSWSTCTKIEKLLDSNLTVILAGLQCCINLGWLPQDAARQKAIGRDSFQCWTMFDHSACDCVMIIAYFEWLAVAPIAGMMSDVSALSTYALPKPEAEVFLRWWQPDQLLYLIQNDRSDQMTSFVQRTASNKKNYLEKTIHLCCKDSKTPVTMLTTANRACGWATLSEVLPRKPCSTPAPKHLCCPGANVTYRIKRIHDNSPPGTAVKAS